MASRRKPVEPEPPRFGSGAAGGVRRDRGRRVPRRGESRISPWFQVSVRDTYDDLARWTRESGVAAVLLDIDTEGEDPYGGLPVLNELRSLNERPDADLAQPRPHALG